MKRTCAECDKNILFNKDTLDQVIRFEKKHYHYDCFINACKKKSKRSNASPKWVEALNSIEEIQQDTKNYYNCNNDLQKDEIYNFILENYNTMIVPPYVFIKLEDIYSGKRKGLTCEIPPEDILDMWKRKMTYLNKLRAKNIALGKNMTVAQQINYDLTVLVNKYDDYLRWKEQNKIVKYSTNQECIDKLATVDLDKLSIIAQVRQKEEDDDMDALLDELFD